MVDDTSRNDREESQPPEFVQRLRLVLVAFCGAVTTVFFWYIPLAPIAGGAIAGYFHQGTEREARFVGAIAGLLVPVVVVLVAAPVVLLGGGSIFGQWPFSPAVMVLVMVGSVVYSAGVSAIGGHIGGTVMQEEESWGTTVFDE